MAVVHITIANKKTLCKLGNDKNLLDFITVYPKDIFLISIHRQPVTHSNPSSLRPELNDNKKKSQMLTECLVFRIQIVAVSPNSVSFVYSINLITGHVEEPMPNPMDEMTEEQKEYEAMKLVNMFDKLSRYCHN